MLLDQEKYSPGLYIVSTPIGNAYDISLRALSLLKNADLVACEDTRVTRKLFAIHRINSPLTAYHDYNAEYVRPSLIATLEQDKIIALVSDAGTPLISDPGYKLVKECQEKEINVTCIPGPCSVIAGLTLSGLPTNSFYFAGFPPSKSSARQEFFFNLQNASGTLIFFESAKRLRDSLLDMLKVLGNRSAVIARELTKKFEEIRKGNLENLINHYATYGLPKGEIIVLLDAEQPILRANEDLNKLLKLVLNQETLRDAVDLVTATTGLPRRQVYEHALFIKADDDQD